MATKQIDHSACGEHHLADSVLVKVKQPLTGRHINQFAILLRDDAGHEFYLTKDGRAVQR